MAFSDIFNPAGIVTKIGAAIGYSIGSDAPIEEKDKALQSIGYPTTTDLKAPATTAAKAIKSTLLAPLDWLGNMFGRAAWYVLFFAVAALVIYVFVRTKVAKVAA